jgi:murein DD-endopeptidase MepM/ murein hydrolase activator NlpD
MRSLFLTTALLGAILALPAPAPASSPASPELGGLSRHLGDVRHEPQANAERRALTEQAARQATEHQQMLAALFDQAEQFEHQQQEQAEKAATLAAVGWTGDDVDAAAAVRPISAYHLSAGYGVAGPRWATMHSGLDLAAPSGTTIVAAADATVTSVAFAGAYGLRTILTLEDGTQIWYCHQSATLVRTGENVEIAQPVGLVGSTGNSTGPHLHLEVRPEGGPAIDPMPWFAAHGIEF